ncbi:MAG: hypothetical protein KY475_06075 [Planctomycetes bacterium]|nr:hypothetical protein [Planctomycetota bacterium]
MNARSLLTLLLAAAAAAAGGCGTPLKQHNLPPAQQLMEPGPGVGGPGPGVLPPVGPPVGPMAGFGPYGCAPAGALGVGMPGPSAQIWFAIPEGAQVRWEAGPYGFASTPLVMPGRQNFPMGGIYRLKLTNIYDRPGVELYPTLEISPATPRTIAYLEHNAIPIQFTDEDFAQVLAGNMVTKVIYLPDPEFQELVAGVETLVSTRLDPGLDPIVEADRRGAILAILRMGNKDLETPSAGAGYGPMLGVPGAPLPGYPQVPGYPPMNGYPPAPGAPGVLPNTPDAATPLDEPPAPPDPNVSPAAHNHEAAAAAGAAPGALPVQPVSGGPYYAPPIYPTHSHYGAPAGPVPYGAAGMPPPYVVGVTAPTYGYPITGTPIGLPGPPHIPLGVPAGLQSHKMRNWTRTRLPQPTEHQRVHVQHRPGFSYPRPASRAFIQTQMIHPAPSYRQPPGNKFKVIQ